MTHVNCPKCSARLRVPPSQGLLSLCCPACGEMFETGAGDAPGESGRVVPRAFGLLGLLGAALVAGFSVMLADQWLVGTRPDESGRPIAASARTGKRTGGSSPNNSSRPTRKQPGKPDKNSTPTKDLAPVRTPPAAAEQRVAVPPWKNANQAKGTKPKGRPAVGKAKGAPTIRANPGGNFSLLAQQAWLFGPGLKFRKTGPAITNWTTEAAYVRWRLLCPEAGAFKASITYGCASWHAGVPFAVIANGAKIPAKTVDTGGLAEPRKLLLGTFEMPKGIVVVEVHALGKVETVLMKLVRVTLIRVKK